MASPATGVTSANGPDAAAHESNAIINGKKHAKAVLAASGVNITGVRGYMASAASSDAINGASPSRKRSRSSTRRSSHTPMRAAASPSRKR
jgi:SWI/SNF-related matrix-associated actin-dependent regulator of chromatin subfamily B protein 1